MSLPLYHPSSHAMIPPTESQYASYLKRAESSRTKIPARLSFEEIIRNSTHSPCSLDDFIDYLVYVERSAENLQFFLWYCSYVGRWSQLPEKEKEPSPAWRISKRPDPQSPLRSARLGEGTDKLDRILKIMARGLMTTTTTTPSSPQQNTPNTDRDSRASGIGTNFSRPRTPAPLSVVKEGDRDEWRWQPFSAQPFRDEVTQVVRHYISGSGPRSLNLTDQDRTACMHALQHTTHPTAFLPAFLAADTVLRGHSHPNFIRRNICNSNRPRIMFARALGVFLIGLALILDVILILSKLNRLVRLSALPLWYVGLYILLIGGRGISISLYMNRKRQLRPWEGPDADAVRTHSGAKMDRAELHNPTKYPEDDNKRNTKGRSSPKKESLQAFGPTNDFERETWVRSYEEKPYWQKVFDVSVVNRNRHLRALQDRVVLKALLWASFLVVVLTVGSVLIPSADLY
ncbi:hypothetical protein GGR54DRAFT_17614 [Hypoxylon sp. NC1633]|nr:hypothetical protein GGR54DRAFT_17614 [Hypoxylon sp. NC1633]